MKIQRWVKALNIQLDLQYPAYCDSRQNNWRARLESNHSGLIRVFDERAQTYDQLVENDAEGLGKTPELALNNLCEAMRGKVLVFEPYDGTGTKTKAFDIPEDLTS